MTNMKPKKYSPEMEKAIRDAAEANGGVMNLLVATELAKNPLFADKDIGPRGIAAKTRTMTPPVPYAKAERTAKDGSPVARKDEIVTEVAFALGLDPETIKSLAKAEKLDLRVLADAVKLAVRQPELAD
jgi:hypothetical protein